MYLERLRLDGHRALVIGAGGGGMGTESVLAMAEAGADVIALDHSAEQLADLERLLATRGGKCVTRVTDVLDRPSLTGSIQAVVAEHGPVHTLVNVVGGMQRGQWGPSHEYPDDAFEHVLAFNLSWVASACREVASGMVQHEVPGSIINFASVSGVAAAPWHGAYGAAKAGIMSLTRTMAVELGRYGIRVNAVAPGSIATPRGASVTIEDAGPGEADSSGPPGPFWDNVRRVTPLGRPGRPDDVAGVVLFLASGLARLITGQTIVVDGGMTARSPIAEASVFESLAAQSAG